jgi:histidinol-phosphate aminotransferase
MPLPADHGTIGPFRLCQAAEVLLTAPSNRIAGRVHRFRPPTEETMSRYWSAVVHGLTPYVPGEQPKLDNLVKLNTNEHPYGPSPRALEAIRAATGPALRLYPDPNAEALKRALADYHGLRPDQVFVGNGSDEVLAHAFLALLNQAQPLWFPDITYSFYPVYCGLYGIRHETVPLADDYSIRADDYLPTPERRAGGIIFPNPNAPTGRLMTLAEIERVLAANPDVVVVVDEAYVDFGGKSAAGLVDRYSNLLVVQTFSKSRALAGLRVGFALGHRDLIEALDRVKNSFNSYPLDRLAIAGAVASVQDEAHFQECRLKVMATREVMATCLRALGFEVLPSAANFIFVRHPERDAAELAAALRERAIIVRHFRLPRIDQFLRITVGTDEQCGILIEALKDILGQCVCHPGGHH